MGYDMLNGLRAKITYCMIASGVLFILFICSLWLYRGYFMGEPEYGYVLGFVTIIQVPFFLVLFFGFWLVGLYYGNRILRYSMIAFMFYYPVLLSLDGVGLWGMYATLWYVRLLTYLVVFEGLLSLTWSVGVLGLREHIGWAAVLLGLGLFIRGLCNIAILLDSVGFLINLIGFFLNILVWPATLFFLYRVIADLR